MTLRYRKSIRFDVVLVPIMTSLLVSSIAIRLTPYIPVNFIKMFLGIFLVLLSIFLTFFSSRMKIKPGIITGIIVGALSGLGTGFFSIGAPPVVVYLLSCLETKEEYFGSIQFLFLVADLWASIFRFMSGVISFEIAPFILFGYLGVAIGIFAGLKLISRINSDMLKKMIYAFMALSGISTFITSYLNYVA